MKRVLFLVMLALSGVSAFAYDFKVEGIYYNITSTSNLTVEVTYENIWDNSAYGYPYRCTYIGNVKIPEYVDYAGDRYSVTKIGEFAFCTSPSSNLEGYMKNLKSINLPSSITTIGQNAFYMCDALSSLIIPSSVTQIGDQSLWCRNVQWIAFLSPNPPSIVTGGGIASSIHSFLVPQQVEFWIPSKKNYSKVKDFSNFTLIEMLTPTSRSFEYSGQVPTVEWTNNLSGYTMSASDVTLQKDAGTHSTDIRADFYKDDELDFSVEFPYEYIINKATLNAKVNNASREYGEDNPLFSVTYYGFVNDENESAITTGPTFTTTATKTSNVGEYPITASGGEAINYDFVYEPGVLTVTKAPLSAKVNDATKVYGANNPTFTINYSGLKNEETVPAWTKSPTFQTEAKKQSGVGQYIVNALNGVPKNYDLGEITSGTLTITPAPLTIKANNVTKQYYNENPTLKYTCSGFMNSDNESVLSPTPTLSTTATQSSNVGTYEISVEGASSPNYSVSHVNGTLTITPRTLKASIGNYSRLYNEENPEFEVVYDGFVGNEDKSVLKEEPVASTTATETSNVGTYKINVSGGSADNYTFSYTSGTLTINKAEQTIAWNQDLSNLNIGDQVELQAVASSGLPITYTMDNNSVAEIYSTGNRYYLDCLAEGQFIIHAVQNGNSNYYSSPRSSKAVTIIGATPPSDPTLTINQADNGTISMQVSRGRTYTFTIAPNYGWKIHTVMFNNTDVTNQLSSDYKYTTPVIINNSWLSVVYEEIDEDAVTSVAESNVKIQGTSFGARVLDAELGDMIRVYTTDGKLQHSLMVDGSSVDVPLAKDNIYIIQVGTKTVKLGH